MSIVKEVDNVLNEIKQLQTQKREDGLTLIKRIFDNIISNPSEPKYRNINLDAISKRIGDENLWTQLLLHSGFDTNHNFNDTKRMLFNMEKLEQLKFVNELLSSYDFDQSWLCSICSFKNQFSTNSCDVCDNTHEHEDEDADGWECESCKFINDWLNNTCQQCGDKGFDFDDEEDEKNITDCSKNITDCTSGIVSILN
eukprot:91179_1